MNTKGKLYLGLPKRPDLDSYWVRESFESHLRFSVLGERSIRTTFDDY